MNDTLETIAAPASAEAERSVMARLTGVLASLRRERRLSRTGAALWPLPLMALGLAVLDAMAPLPAPARVLAGLVVLALAVRLVAALRLPRAVRGARVERAARLIEERMGRGDNALISAVQLRPAAGGAGLSGMLATRALERGAEAARAAGGVKVVDARGAIRLWSIAGAAVLLLAGAVALWPRVFSAATPRFLDPLGDHPPYCPTVFTLAIDPPRPLVGDDVTVTVDLSGPRPETLSVVQLDGAGASADRAVMRPVVPVGEESATPSRHRHVLREVRERTRIYVEGATGRSATLLIDPLPEPRILDASMTITPPAYARRGPLTLRGSALLIESGTEGPEPPRTLVGSSVEVTVSATLELGGAEAEPSDTAGPGPRVAGRSVTHRFVLGAPGEVAFSLRPVGASGLASAAAARGVVVAVIDEPPVIEITRPAKPGTEVFALLGSDVPVELFARDDVGLAEVGATLRVFGADGAARGEGQPLPLDGPEGTFEAGGLRFAGTAVIRTRALNLSAGDAVELVTMAGDARGEPFGGPQLIATAPLRILVLDEEEFQRRFAKALDIAGVIEPYLMMSREAAAIAERAAKIEEAARTAGSAPDELLADALRRDRAAMMERHDRLAREIERRLALPPAVSFDEQMKAPLEALQRRLVPISEEGPGDGARPARDARVAALARDGARVEIERPAAALALADVIQQSVDGLQGVIKRQRGLVDRLEGKDEADASDRRELAAVQNGIGADLESSLRRMERTGAAALEPLRLEPARSLVNDLTEARAALQRDLEAVRRRAEADPGAQREARGAANAAADAALTLLHPAVEQIARALREEAERAPHPYPGGAPEWIEKLPAFAAGEAPVAAAPSNPVLQEQLPAAAEALRLVRERLAESGPASGAEPASLEHPEVLLRTIEQREAPPLPRMGVSASMIAGLARECGAAGLMESASTKLLGGSVPEARVDAMRAAEALESLYSAAAQQQKQEGAGEGLDRDIGLTDPNRSAEDDEGQSAEGDDGEQRGPPDTLSQLSKNREPGSGSGEGDSRSMHDERLAKEPGAAEDESAPERAGMAATGEEAPNEAGAKGEPAEAGGQDSAPAAREAASARARFFNQMLYDTAHAEAEPASSAQATGAGGEPEDPATTAADPEKASRAEDIRRAIERVSGGSVAGEESQAAYAQVPPAYRQIVGDYFLRLAGRNTSKTPEEKSRP